MCHKRHRRQVSFGALVSDDHLVVGLSGSFQSQVRAPVDVPLRKSLPAQWSRGGEVVELHLDVGADAVLEPLRRVTLDTATPVVTVSAVPQREVKDDVCVVADHDLLGCLPDHLLDTVSHLHHMKEEHNIRHKSCIFL